MDEQLERKLRMIQRMGGFPEVVDAPKAAISFDKMIIVYLDTAHKRLYQVHFWWERSKILLPYSK